MTLDILRLTYVVSLNEYLHPTVCFSDKFVIVTGENYKYGLFVEKL